MLSMLFLTTIMLSTALPLSREELKIEDFTNVAEDCLPKKVFGRTLPICDLSPAFKRAADACELKFDRAWIPDKKTGCTFSIPRGHFYLSQPIGHEPRESCYNHTIQGAGTENDTTLYVEKGESAFYFHGYGWCAAEGLNVGGTNISLFNISLVSLGNDTNAPTYGVYAGKTLHAENVRVDGFTVGIMVDASVGRPSPGQSNANVSYMNRLSAVHNEHAGIYLEGSDSNASLLLNPTSWLNCKRASKWEPILNNIACRGIIDASFIGNTTIAGHTASNYETLADKTVKRYPGYEIGDTPNNRGVCIGCYAEQDQPASVLGANANSIGGIGSWSGGSGYIQGSRVGGLIFHSKSGEVRLGNNATTGAFIEFNTPLTSDTRSRNTGLALRYDFSLYGFRWDVANSGRIPLFIHSDRDNISQMGTLRLFKTPVLIGNMNSKDIVSQETPAPTLPTAP